MSTKSVRGRVAIAPIAPLASSSRQDPRPVLSTTKEWIVPPRPKPGRKPQQVVQEETESSRKAINRASQRAFRERKQEYIVELEEKLRVLEQGEGDKALFFQRQAQRAKEESTALRTENQGLKALVEELRRQLKSLTQESHSHTINLKGSGKREDATENEQDAPPAKRTRRRNLSVDEHDLPRSEPTISTSPPSSSTIPFKALSPPLGDRAISPSGEPCGLCSSDSSCFCAEVGYHIDHSRPSTTFNQPLASLQAIATFSSSMAVPLRRSRPSNGVKPPIWHLDPAIKASPALCNGDPSNCPACSDDPFGKAFCASLSSSVCATNPCANCPRSTSTSNLVPSLPNLAVSPLILHDDNIFEQTLADLPCCGKPAECGSLICSSEQESAISDRLLPLSVPPGVRSNETVPCNEAWEALKLHPNIAFADLQMLADVVAKRTRCDGPVSSPLSVPMDNHRQSGSTDRMEMVPQSSLMCAADSGTRKRLTVERGAVNDALEILDRAVGRGGPLRK